MVLICIFLMANVEHLFMGLFAIFVSSSVKYLFMSFAHFLIRLFFLLMSFESSLFILDTSPLSNTWLLEFLT